MVYTTACEGPSTVESFYEGAYALTYLEIYDYAEERKTIYNNTAGWQNLMGLTQPILTLYKNNQFSLHDGKAASMVKYKGHWDIHESGLYAKTADQLITGRMWKSKKILYFEVHGYPLDENDKALHSQGLKIDMLFSEESSWW